MERKGLRYSRGIYERKVNQEQSLIKDNVENGNVWGSYLVQYCEVMQTIA